MTILQVVKDLNFAVVVLFTLLGGVLLLGDSAPSALGWVGIALVAGGIVLSSLSAAGEKG